mmetsp:Transcript_46942/g.142435  ORF Transcript_46942/g.142435 Transcript_46942/m.142435 type:complete len:87 (-) Transcript_46942:64-324(-)
MAERCLGVTHPIRLGLALTFSVFQFEVLGNPREACQAASAALQAAAVECAGAAGDPSEGPAAVLQILRDNLTHWTSGSPPRVASRA